MRRRLPSVVRRSEPEAESVARGFPSLRRGHRTGESSRMSHRTAPHRPGSSRRRIPPLPKAPTSSCDRGTSRPSPTLPGSGSSSRVLCVWRSGEHFGERMSARWRGFVASARSAKRADADDPRSAGMRVHARGRRPNSCDRNRKRAAHLRKDSAQRSTPRRTRSHPFARTGVGLIPTRIGATVSNRAAMRQRLLSSRRLEGSRAAAPADSAH